MESIKFSKLSVSLLLTQAKGKIRIADENGNHIKKPTTEGKNIETNYIEWMITNNEISKLINLFLDKNDKEELVKELEGLKDFIRDTKYATREAVKTTSEKLDKFVDFDVYKYTENFYSFEKQIISKIIIRITFKMGDYTLAPHMFVLLPFGHNSVKIENINGEVNKKDCLGSKCYGIWKPNKEDILEIIRSLSYASGAHRNDLIKILKS